MIGRTRQGDTLIGLLVTTAIIAILAAVYFTGKGTGETKGRKDGIGRTIIGRSIAGAKDDVCRSNLGQVRAAIQIARANADDAPPADLKETRLGDSFYRCPLGKEPYAYNPETGEVKCVHLGHEKY
jgi:hypothetical protein